MVPLVAGLAVIQAVAEFWWATQSIRAGEADFGRGVVLLPLMAAALFARGGFAALLGVLYALFAWATLTGRSRAWALGLIAVVLSAFAILALIAAGEAPAQIARRAVIPAILLVFLLVPAGRRALRPAPALTTKVS
jgi:hypothetical protein